MKSRSVQFSRAETEALLALIHHVGVSSVAGCESERAAVNEVYCALPIAARRRTANTLNDKIWSVWADTHPEEGPFK